MYAPDECQKCWETWYTASETQCAHAYWYGACHRRGRCEVGLRSRTYFVLSGSVLNVWARVEHVLAARSPHHSVMQIVRLRTSARADTEESQRIVGSLIPAEAVPDVIAVLSSKTGDVLARQ